MEAAKRLLRVALVGAPNAGKSTLLNKLILADLSCVSNKVHTTRKNVLGVYTEANTQLEFIDSPGIITRQHLLRHHLEDTLLTDPNEATRKCDLIGVVVDASNARERQRLNRGIVDMLNHHRDKRSYLILNKVDLVKEKRLLLEIGLRLSEGCLEGKRLIPKKKYDSLFPELSCQRQQHQDQTNYNHTSNHVIELKPINRAYHQKVNSNDQLLEQQIGFNNFTQIFSISALEDDGVDELREHMLDLAKPVETWPHGPDYLSNLNTKEIVYSVVRGKVMDYTNDQIPYVVKYKLLDCKYDELGSLHVNLDLICPKKYMIGKLLGEKGVVIFRIIGESRELLSRTLACDVKLNITVRSN